MWRILALIVLAMAAPALAHQDTLFEIKPNGTLHGIPAKWGPVKLTLRFSPSGSRRIDEVVISSPRFRTRLNPCLLRLMPSSSKDHVRARGSWYHDPAGLPPYVSLDFYASASGAEQLAGESVTVVISLEDGRIVMGLRSLDPWWGPIQGKRVAAPGTCSSWATALWPNNSFKPTPLHGAA
jgi:hypothetical protein